MDSLINLLNISVADAKELANEVDYDFTSNFSDGESDGENNFEPIAYQWFNSDYRKGYLSGIAKRIGIEYTPVDDVRETTPWNDGADSDCVKVNKVSLSNYAAAGKV